MRNIKRTILVVIVISATVCLAKTTSDKAKQNRAKALELLDKFTETIDRVHTSFISKSKTHVHDKIKHGDPQAASMNGERDNIEAKHSALLSDKKERSLSNGGNVAVMEDQESMLVASRIEVLQTIKGHSEFRKIPVIMVTTTDASREAEKCYELGYNNYVANPVDYDRFEKSIRHLGLFLKVVKIPDLIKERREYTNVCR